MVAFSNFNPDGLSGPQREPESIRLATKAWDNAVERFGWDHPVELRLWCRLERMQGVPAHEMTAWRRQREGL
ncbi:hypothetical protein LCGC14_2898880 [marine sediment metagenome]|uniref:Uncharacterized protein n=1 Tax=marine sediment metagenome TaxID=412755 RepID=A0A0F8XV28_9ZZZZ